MPLPLGATRYLLRFDDICPTMNWEIWSEIVAALLKKELKPILAVMPDNQDETLRISLPANNFWERVRAWQAFDWTIGVHGYQHRYVSRHRGIVTGRRKSEFAGFQPPNKSGNYRRPPVSFKMRESNRGYG